MKEKTNILVLLLYVLIGFSTTSCSPVKKSEPHDERLRLSATMRSYGLYRDPLPQTLAPKGLYVPSYLPEIQCLKRSDTIEAGLATMIGVRYLILDLLDFETNSFLRTNLRLTFRVIAPSDVQGCATDSPQRIFDKQVSLGNTVPYGYFLWSFRETCSQASGEWTFLILHNEDIILEKTLNVCFTGAELALAGGSDPNRVLDNGSIAIGLYQYGEYKTSTTRVEKEPFFPRRVDDNLILQQKTDLADVTKTNVMAVICYVIGLFSNKQERLTFRFIPSGNGMMVNEREVHSFTRTLEDVLRDGCICCFKTEGLQSSDGFPQKWTIQIANADGFVLAEKTFYAKGTSGNQKQVEKTSRD